MDCILNIQQTEETHTDKLTSISIEVNIRVKQRNGRKNWTFVEGLNSVKDIDLKKLIKSFRKKHSCGGSIHEDPDTKQSVLQLQGKHGDAIKDFLISEGIVDESCIKMHG